MRKKKTFSTYSRKKLGNTLYFQFSTQKNIETERQDKLNQTEYHHALFTMRKTQKLKKTRKIQNVDLYKNINLEEHKVLIGLKLVA